MTIHNLRHYAIARSLFAPTTLKRALERMGFLQAPARAQDLILRHRVRNYRAGDLERRYVHLDVHEDVFINYGFVTGVLQALMHPRGGLASSPAGSARRARALLEFVHARGPVH